jgi:hypothetical protein
MIFLIEYDRQLGVVVEVRRFPDAERPRAEEARLELELTLGRQRVDREVVLLEALSEEVLRRTHRRYFEALSELATPPEPGENSAS